VTGEPDPEAGAELWQLFEQVAHLLHDLCQPLTALQCRLEIDQLEHEGQAPSSRDQTMTDCVRQCARMNETIQSLRSLVRQAPAKYRESSE
jgi:signal transduction histidine kinase